MSDIPPDDLRERIARAIEAEADRVTDDDRYYPRSEPEPGGYFARGLRAAARIARETPPRVHPRSQP